MFKRLPSQERLKEIFNYDPATGVFTYKSSSGRIKAGSVAGTMCSAGYKVIGVDWVKYRANRLAWKYVTGKDPEGLVDHRDLDTLNNAFDNLRDVTHAQNMMNKSSVCNNSSGRRNIQDLGGRFKVRLKLSGKMIYIGTYATLEEAIEARNSAAKQHYGEFCQT